jgi:putative ABC transport system permease protein
MGVVGDARELGIHDEPVPTVYSCFSAPSPIPWYLVRTTGDPVSQVADIRRTITQLEPLRSVYDIVPLETRIGDTQAQTRLRTILLTLFAATALGLVCAGVYGTLSYAVTLRRREVALRLALGALRHTLVRQLLDTSARVVGAGCACGLVLALLFARTLQTMLYGVSPTDPATLAGVMLLVVTVAGFASLVPALRATLPQPMRALRDE